MVCYVIRYFLLFISLSLTSMYATAKPVEPLTVALMDGGRPPYYWMSSEGSLTGIYVDLLKLIEKHSGINFTFKFMPQSRIRLRMISGNIDIEPGISVTWRQKPGEKESAVYSQVFMSSEEAWVYSTRHELSALDNEEIETLKPCSIHGFDSITIQKKPEPEIRALSEQQIIQLIEKGRCDYALMPLDVYSYLNGNSTFRVQIGRPHINYNLRFRISKQHAHILPDINKALAILIDNGEVERLLVKYTLRRENDNEAN